MSNETVSMEVLGSKLSTAVKFKTGFTADVLPPNSRAGGYIQCSRAEVMRRQIRHAKEKILRATLKGESAEEQRLQVEQQKKLIGEQDTEIRRLNGVVDEQVVSHR